MFDIYDSLPFVDQFLHAVHFIICALAVLIACVPLLTPKGSEEHKFGGMLYLPVSCVALLLACFMAWREASLVLLAFNGFCAYLLLSGWRAVHEKENPVLIDWLIPAGLFVLASGMAFHAMFFDEGKRSFYLMFFAFNGFYLALRDWRHLRGRSYWQKHKIFLVDTNFGNAHATDWLGRHIAGMIGSLMANLSVVVLTLLPIEWHWLWPATLIALAAAIAVQQHRKKRRLHAVTAIILQPKFRTYGVVRPKRDEDISKAA